MVTFTSFFPDPFTDAAKGDEEGVQDGLVHIRIQQRNGRKTLTTVQGLSKEYDLKKIVRSCKKVEKELCLIVMFKYFFIIILQKVGIMMFKIIPTQVLLISKLFDLISIF